MENSAKVMEILAKLLSDKNVDFKILDIDKLEHGFDFAFIIGGDGTILKVARFYSGFNTPIFGINLGRLGFLSQTTVEDLETSVSEILSGNYRKEKRMMLEGNGHVALNDFVIKGSSSRTSRFALEINGKFVCEYLSDGIIISTPTGSTAYGMSAGGPVLAPETNVIEIVPICPHSFSARPIIVSGDDEISILPFDDYEYNVSVDGQIAFPLKNNLTVRKSKDTVELALLNNNDFFSVLRNKLQWSFAPTKK
jgi:NAD+ kinase